MSDRALKKERSLCKLANVESAWLVLVCLEEFVTSLVDSFDSKVQGALLLMDMIQFGQPSLVGNLKCF